jgi:hypothetical protein
MSFYSRKHQLGFLFASGLLLGALLCNKTLQAQTTAGNAAYQFLKLPYTAKATSLGGLNISSIGNDLGLAMMQHALLTTNMDGNLQVSVKPYFAGIQQYDLNGANIVKSDWVIGWGVHFQVSGLSSQEPGTGARVQVRVAGLIHSVLPSVIRHLPSTQSSVLPSIPLSP